MFSVEFQDWDLLVITAIFVSQSFNLFTRTSYIKITIISTVPLLILNAFNLEQGKNLISLAFAYHK